MISSRLQPHCDFIRYQIEQWLILFNTISINCCQNIHQHKCVQSDFFSHGIGISFGVEKMYAEWTSLSPIIAANSNGSPNSVLTKFGGSAGRDVSTAVVKQLASNSGITQTPEPSILLCDDEVRFQLNLNHFVIVWPDNGPADIGHIISIYCFHLKVNWCMSVICHGLSLPLSEHETIKDCVNVYCEWLTALLPAPRISVPKPICEDPNLYARKIISHLHNLFVPRHGEGEHNKRCLTL